MFDFPVAARPAVASKRPAGNAGRLQAIWSVASSAVLGMIALVGFTIALPNDFSKIAASATPLVDIVNQWLGSGLSTAQVRGARDGPKCLGSDRRHANVVAA